MQIFLELQGLCGNLLDFFKIINVYQSFFTINTLFDKVNR